MNSRKQGVPLARTPAHRGFLERLKPLVAMLLLLAGAVVVVGCGDDGDGGSEAGGDSYELAFIPGVKGDAFYTSMQCGVESEAAKIGASVEVQASDKFDPTTQTPLVQAIAAQQPDALLIAPTDTKAMYAPIKQVADAGSKIVLVDTTLDNPNLAVSGIASDYEALGETAADQLLDLIGGEGKVMMIGVQPGISTLDAGQVGFENVVEDTPGVEYLGIQYGQNDQAKVSSIISATLAQHPDLVGVFTPSGPDQAGVVNALKRDDKVGEVKIVSADAQPPQVEQLENGEVQVLIGQKPFDMGVQGVQQAVAALNGEPTEESIVTGIFVATPDNLDDPEIKKYLYVDSC